MRDRSLLGSRAGYAARRPMSVLLTSLVMLVGCGGGGGGNGATGGTSNTGGTLDTARKYDVKDAVLTCAKARRNVDNGLGLSFSSHVSPGRATGRQQMLGSGYDQTFELYYEVWELSGGGNVVYYYHDAAMTQDAGYVGYEWKPDQAGADFPGRSVLVVHAFQGLEGGMVVHYADANTIDQTLLVSTTQDGTDTVELEAFFLYRADGSSGSTIKTTVTHSDQSTEVYTATVATAADDSSTGTVTWPGYTESFTETADGVYTGRIETESGQYVATETWDADGNGTLTWADGTSESLGSVA